MKKLFTLALLSSICMLQGHAQEIKLVTDSDNGATIKNTSGNFVSRTKTVNGKQMEDFSKSAKVLTMEKGSPALPVFTSSVVIADQGNVTLEVQYDSFEEFHNVEVAPSKGSLKRNINPANVPYTFGEVYQTNAFYPGQLAKVSSPFIVRDVRGATVSFYPYQYNPVTKTLRVYRNITARVTNNNAQNADNTKTKHGGSPNQVFDHIYDNLFLNYTPFYDQVAEDGEMLIVAPEDYLETIAPLAEWKLKKGINTTVVPLSEVGSSAIQIKNFIGDFYDENPGLTYIVLVGDHEDLPSHTYGTTEAGEELWSDSYYAQLEGTDYFPEVLVGRFSGSVEDVTVMVNRTLEYETNPLEGDWMTRIAGIGSTEGEGYGDDGEPDWFHLRGIGEKLLDYGYTYVNEFYDGSQGGNDAEFEPLPSMISDAVNEGIGLLNYCGHGAQDLFVTGMFTSNDVIGLENEGKYPFIVSVACNNGTFTGGTSLCETWLRVGTEESPTGAIAACGSSILMSWAEPMQTQDGMADLITLSDPENVKTTLGGLFYNGQMSTLEAYGFSPTAIEVMQTWVFFGDPSVVYRNQVTQEIIAEHTDLITVEDSQVTVECDVEGAFVSIIQDGVIIGTGVVEDGQVVIDLEEFNDDSVLLVTITQQNFKPYLGEITVEEEPVSGLNDINGSTAAVYPNPAKEFIKVKLGSGMNSASFEVRDITGKLIHSSQTIQGNGEHTIDTSGYAAGVYLLTLKNSTLQETHKFIIK